MAKPKTPKWREQWEKLVGDHKYLVIRNWDEYQQLTPSGYPARWIKDYVNADFDTPLPLFTTGLLDRLRRFRGRLGSNIPANLELILSGCAVIGQDRHNVPAALVQLLSSGRLIPSNQSDEVSKRSKAEQSEENKPLNPLDDHDNSPSQTGGADQEPNLGETPNPYPGSDQCEENEELVRWWASTLSKAYRGKPLDTPAELRRAGISCFKYLSACDDASRKRLLKAFFATQSKAPVPSNGNASGGARKRDSVAPARQLEICPDCRNPVGPNDDVLMDQNRGGVMCSVHETCPPFNSKTAPELAQVLDADKCECKDPLPDANGNSSEMYGVSCRRCGNSIDLSDVQIPTSKAFQIEEDETQADRRRRIFEIED